MAFPLLEIPIVAFDIVFRNLEIIELINLSECSKRCKALVAEGSRVDRTFTCDVTMMEAMRKVVVSSDRREAFVWSSTPKRHVNTGLLNVFVDHWLDGVRWRVSPSQDGWMSVRVDDDELITWVSYIKRLFHCPITSFRLELRRPLDFAKLFIETDVFRRADLVYFHRGALSHAELTYLLDHLVADQFLFYGWFEAGFQYTKPLRFAYFEICDATWLGCDQLISWMLAKTCRAMDLWGVNLTSEQLNRVVAAWMESSDKTLEYVSLALYTDYRTSEPFEPIQPDLDTILHGIPHTRAVPKRPDAVEYFDRDGRYEEGRDIRRSDGTLATITVNEHLSGRFEVTLTVWHCENPNADPPKAEI